MRHAVRPGLARRHAQLPLVQRRAEPAAPVLSLRPHRRPRRGRRASGRSRARPAARDRRRVARRQRPAQVAGRARSRSTGRGRRGGGDLGAVRSRVVRARARPGPAPLGLHGEFPAHDAGQGDRQGRSRSGAGSYGGSLRGAPHTDLRRLRSRWSRRRSTDSPTSTTTGGGRRLAVSTAHSAADPARQRARRSDRSASTPFRARPICRRRSAPSLRRAAATPGSSKGDGRGVSGRGSSAARSSSWFRSPSMRAR